MTPHPRSRQTGPGDRGRLPPAAPRTIMLVLLVLVVCVILFRAGTAREAAPGSPPRDLVENLLNTVRVVDERVSVPGYDRDCSGTSACVFGPAWSDHTSAPGSGNGCPTRHDVLARDLQGAATSSTASCSIHDGFLVDPYTGRVVDVGITGVRGIHVDHIFPLAAAWDLGAWTWTPQRRAAFANDIDRNLVAVTGSVNTGKSDSTPEEWLPPDSGRHCFYAARYLTAAVAYGLPVTRADHDALTSAVQLCPPGDTAPGGQK